jgi:hypothetical protein
MPESPQKDRRRHQHNAKDLVAPVGSRLNDSPREFAHLLVIRFDATLNQARFSCRRPPPDFQARHASV